MWEKINENLENNKDSSWNLDVLKDLSLSEAPIYLRDMKEKIRLDEKTEIWQLFNISTRVNNICVSLSELDITDAKSYKDLSIEWSSYDEISSKTQSIITKLTTPPPSGMTQEKKEYFERFKEFFDNIYDTHNIPQNKRTYTVPSLDFTRQPWWVNLLTKEQQEYIVNEIQESAMCKKNVLLSAIKWCQKNILSFSNKDKDLGTFESHKNHIRSYWLSMNSM